MSDFKISCPHCSQNISLDSAWSGQVLNCPACQKSFTVPNLGTGTPPAPAEDRPRLRTASPPTAPAPVPLPTAAAATPAPRVSGLAIASLVLSLLGCFFITAIAGVICGHMARNRIRRNPSLSGGGVAMAGLIIGYLIIALTVAGGVKFILDVKHQVNEIMAQAQSNDLSNRNSTAAPAGTRSSAGAAIHSSVPVPADAVSGTVKGESFQYTRSTLARGVGSLEIDGRKTTKEGVLIDIFLSSKPGERLENRTWRITPTTAPAAAPIIIIVKLHGGASGQDRIMSGYEMELTTGQISGGTTGGFGGTIAGSITLKIGGAAPVDVKGNFAALVN